MPIILYLIIIIVFIAKAINKSSAQTGRRSSGAGNHANSSARSGQYNSERFTQSHKPPKPAKPAPKSQTRRPQSRTMRHIVNSSSSPYSYRRNGFSYSNLKPNEDGLEVLMRRNRERERELEKRIQ